MKKIFILASLFVAAAFTSCEKSESVAKSETNTILVKAVLPGATRTAVLPGEEGYDVVWTEGDNVKVGNYQAAGNSGYATQPIQINETDAKIGYFSVDTKTGMTDPGVCALYPNSAALQPGAAPSHQGIHQQFFLNFPAAQNAGENTPDPKASLMFAWFAHPGENDGSTYEGVPSYNCEFKHIAAYCKLNFKNLDGTTISKVKFSVNDADAVLAGTTFAYNWEKEQILSNTEAENWTINANQQTATAGVNAVEVTCEAAVDAPVWFALIPSYGKKYTDVTVEVTVDGATKTKNFKGVDLEFKAGIVLSLDVDMTGAE